MGVWTESVLHKPVQVQVNLPRVEGILYAEILQEVVLSQSTET